MLGASLPAVAAELDFDAPRHGSIKDYYGDYERDWHLRRSVRHDCVPREFIRDELPADGWRDFRDPRHHGSVVLVEARRERQGRHFELTIDQCSGEVVGERPLVPPRRAFLWPYHDDYWRGPPRWRDDAYWRGRDEWGDERWTHGPRRYHDAH